MDSNILIILLTFGYFIHDIVAEIQSFRETPKNKMVTEGEDVKLRCAVNNQQGKAQWTKDGFALGFERDVPGYPRYRYEGDESKGEHILIITGITLQDDGEYQCQVGPTSKTVPIWTAANVTVLVPPSKISIVDWQDGSSVEVLSGSTFLLQCLVEDSRPPPVVTWYKNGKLVESGIQSDEEYPGRRNLLTSVVSRIKPTLHSEDDGTVYACRAKHPAVEREAGYLMTSVILSILHSPNKPNIIGYTTSETLKAGQNKEFSCVVQGGNPKPWVTWFRDNKIIDESTIHENKKVINTHSITLSEEDDGATLECRVMSDLLDKAMSTNITLKVHYPSSLVHIRAPSFIQKGDTLDFECESSPSNPASSISLNIDGLEVKASSSKVIENSKKGWRTVSKIKKYRPIITKNKLDIKIECLAFNPVFSAAVRKVYTILIVNPPEEPVMEGLDGNLIAGKNALLSCTSAQGNPPPTISLMKNGVKLESRTSQKGRVTESITEINVQPSDNHLRVTCQVEHIPSGTFLTTSHNLNVLFPPMQIKGSGPLKTVNEGEEVTLSCDSSASNPPANITWRGRDALLDGSTQYFLAGKYGGQKTSSQITIRAMASDDQKAFTCQASNGLEFQPSTNVSVLVNHAPIWIQKVPDVLFVEEGKDLQITTVASARPGPIRYRWWKNGVAIATRDSQLLVQENNLIFKAVSRMLTANYTTAAENSLGSIKSSFNLQVRYPPENIIAPTHRTVNEDSLAEIECSANGSPIPSVHWTKQNDSTVLASGQGTAKLIIKKASRQHTGIYVCTAKNIVDTRFARPSRLIVKHAPNILSSLKSPLQFYAQRGDNVILKCLVRAAPKPNFLWYDPNKGIIRNGSKYFIWEPQLVDTLTLWESRLEVRSVQESDYSTYKCEIHNTFGIDKGFVSLLPPLIPNPPSDLRIVNITSSGVATITWKHPHRSGHQNMGQNIFPIASYVIRYWNSLRNEYKEKEIADPMSRLATITGLQPGIEYTVTISGRNSQGLSSFADPPLILTIPGTIGAARPSSGIDENKNTSERRSSRATVWRIPRLLLLITTLAGTALLALNIAIIACFVRRKKRERNISESSSKTTSLGVYYAPQSPSVDHRGRPEIEQCQTSTSNQRSCTDQDVTLLSKKLLGSSLLVPIDNNTNNQYCLPPSHVEEKQGSMPLDLIQGSNVTSEEKEPIQLRHSHPSNHVQFSNCKGSDTPQDQVSLCSYQSSRAKSPIHEEEILNATHASHNNRRTSDTNATNINKNADETILSSPKTCKSRNYRTLDHRNHKKETTKYSTLQKHKPSRQSQSHLEPNEPVYATINIKTSPRHFSRISKANPNDCSSLSNSQQFPISPSQETYTEDPPKYINLRTFQNVNNGKPCKHNGKSPVSPGFNKSTSFSSPPHTNIMNINATEAYNNLNTNPETIKTEENNHHKSLTEGNEPFCANGAPVPKKVVKENGAPVSLYGPQH